LEGPQRDIREAQNVLLQAMTEQATINVAQWPGMKVGSGYKHDW
jgi:hypothetical protein